ncbi:trypsin-like peptidase domain-containing protein [Ralstonia nicotianae]
MRKILAVAGLLGVVSHALASENSLVLNEGVVLENARRLIHIHHVSVDKSGIVDTVTDGSGFLLDAHHAITAAHVVRKAAERGEPLIVQVGAKARGNYLTTAKVVDVDYRRDLAMLLVNTYTSDPTAENPGTGPVIPGAPGLDNPPARICSTRAPAGSSYGLGGLATKSTGNSSAIEVRWAPRKYESVLDVTTLPPLAERMDVPDWSWQTGDPAIVLEWTANEGDSGGGVFSTDGCFMGVASADVVIMYEGNPRGVTIAVPVLQGDPFLKSANLGQH